MNVMPPLQLLGRADCELCAELYRVLMQEPRVAAMGVELIDIDEHPDLQARHLYRIPVLMRNARELWAGPVDAGTQRELLAVVLAD
jgi:Glutaredoxin-like domain (DUF836)